MWPGAVVSNPVMQLIDTDLTLDEREQVETAMGSDKRVLWFGRPVVKAWTVETTISSAFGLVAAAFLCPFLAELWSWVDAGGGYLFPALFACFLIPFVSGALALLTAPWRRQFRLRRTAYLLTPQRALALEPGRFGKRKLSAWTLHPGMVLEREVAADGSGSLVFAYREEQGKNGTHRKPVGFLHLPHVQEVAALLEEWAAELPVQTESPQVEQGEPARRKSISGALFCAVFLLVGSGILVVAGTKAVNSLQLDVSGVTVPGEVVELGKEKDSEGSTVYYPVFRFTTQNGTEYCVKHDVGSSSPVWSMGEKTEMIYLPDKPKTARPNTFWSKYLASIALGIFGLVFASVGGLGIFCSLTGKFHRREN